MFIILLNLVIIQHFQRKNAAALILQHTWFIHRKKCTERLDSESKLRQHQRKFIAAINESNISIYSNGNFFLC